MELSALLCERHKFRILGFLKDSAEKDVFFRKLPTRAEQLPRPIVTKKLLPLIASALEFGSAAAPALNPLLKIGSWLSLDEFNVKVDVIRSFNVLIVPDLIIECSPCS